MSSRNFIKGKQRQDQLELDFLLNDYIFYNASNNQEDDISLTLEDEQPKYKTIPLREFKMKKREVKNSYEKNSRASSYMNAYAQMMGRSPISLSYENKNKYDGNIQYSGKFKVPPQGQEEKENEKYVRELKQVKPKPASIENYNRVQAYQTAYNNMTYEFKEEYVSLKTINVKDNNQLAELLEKIDLKIMKNILSFLNRKQYLFLMVTNKSMFKILNTRNIWAYQIRRYSIEAEDTCLQFSNPDSVRQYFNSLFTKYEPEISKHYIVDSNSQLKQLLEQKVDDTKIQNLEIINAIRDVIRDEANLLKKDYLLNLSYDNKGKNFTLWLTQSQDHAKTIFSLISKIQIPSNITATNKSIRFLKNDGIIINDGFKVEKQEDKEKDQQINLLTFYDFEDILFKNVSLEEIDGKEICSQLKIICRVSSLENSSGTYHTKTDNELIFDVDCSDPESELCPTVISKSDIDSKYQITLKLSTKYYGLVTIDLDRKCFTNEVYLFESQHVDSEILDFIVCTQEKDKITLFTIDNQFRVSKYEQQKDHSNKLFDYIKEIEFTKDIADQKFKLSPTSNKFQFAQVLDYDNECKNHNYLILQFGPKPQNMIINDLDKDSRSNIQLSFDVVHQRITTWSIYENILLVLLDSVYFNLYDLLTSKKLNKEPLGIQEQYTRNPVQYPLIFDPEHVDHFSNYRDKYSALGINAFSRPIIKFDYLRLVMVYFEGADPVISLRTINLPYLATPLIQRLYKSPRKQLDSDAYLYEIDFEKYQKEAGFSRIKFNKNLSEFKFNNQDERVELHNGNLRIDFEGLPTVTAYLNVFKGSKRHGQSYHLKVTKQKYTPLFRKEVQPQKYSYNYYHKPKNFSVPQKNYQDDYLEKNIQTFEKYESEKNSAVLRPFEREKHTQEFKERRKEEEIQQNYDKFGIPNNKKSKKQRRYEIDDPECLKKKQRKGKNKIYEDDEEEKEEVQKCDTLKSKFKEWNQNEDNNENGQRRAEAKYIRHLKNGRKKNFDIDGYSDPFKYYLEEKEKVLDQRKADREEKLVKKNIY